MGMEGTLSAIKRLTVEPTKSIKHHMFVSRRSLLNDAPRPAGRVEHEQEQARP